MFLASARGQSHYRAGTSHERSAYRSNKAFDYRYNSDHEAASEHVANQPGAIADALHNPLSNITAFRDVDCSVRASKDVNHDGIHLRNLPSPCTPGLIRMPCDQNSHDTHVVILIVLRSGCSSESGPLSPESRCGLRFL